MSPRPALWLGHSQTGGRATITLDDQARLAVRGARANEAAAILAVAALESGARVSVLDLGGAIETKASGHFETFDYNSFLYDSFRLSDDCGAWHAQMIAAAYTAALDFSSEEEAIVNSALQVLANQDNMASPPVLYDALGSVEGFRGFYVDKLKGRIGSLKHLDAANDQLLRRFLEGNVLLSFRAAPYPQAAELAVALMLAKGLALVRSGLAPPLIMVTDAHRIFRASPRFQHGNRLLSYLLGSPFSLAFASNQSCALNPALPDSCTAEILSSDLWHAENGKAMPSVLPNSFVIMDRRSGTFNAFVPRMASARSAEPAPMRTRRSANPALIRAILEEVERFPTATKDSIVSFLSAEHLAIDIEQELDGLHNDRYLILEPKETGVGPKILAYTLTETGSRRLQELRS